MLEQVGEPLRNLRFNNTSMLYHRGSQTCILEGATIFFGHALTKCVGIFITL